MAEVAQQSTLARWTSSQTRAQFVAIASLRFSIFRNGLRRKGGAGDFIANLVMVPIFLLIILGPTVGVTFGAYYCIHGNQPIFLSGLLWIIFAICQFTSIQLGQPGTTFDPVQLIRFPLNFPGYAAVRVFFGLISPSNIVGTMMSFGVALGVSIAVPSLWLYAFAAMFVYALCNIFFTRMLFSWVDRWLSTRRAREIFTALIFTFSIGIQFVNATFNPGFQHGHKDRAANAARIARLTSAYHHAEPVLAILPPGLTANGIRAAQQGRTLAFTAGVAGTVAFTAFFFTIFAIRLKKEFRGENLSDAANAVVATKPKSPGAPSSTLLHASGTIARVGVTTPGGPPVPLHGTDGLATIPATRFQTPPTVSAVFAKEFLYLRRNTGMFYGLIAPLAMVIIFAGRLASRGSFASVLFPAAVAYTMLGIAPMSYNSLGVEAAGIQFYFLAPVSMKDVFLAKNLFNVFLGVAEIIGVFAVVTYVSHAPSMQMTIAVLLWAAFTLFVSMAMGNYRSVAAPKKIEPGKPSGKQASPLSVLIGMGILLVCIAIGAGLILLDKFFNLPWLLVPATLALAVIGYFIYQAALGRMDGLLARKRDNLSEVLCKG